MSRDDLRPLAGLLRQVRDLKRIRDARSPRSLAERAFARSWARLGAGEAPEAVAFGETARAVAAVRLAGLDREAMTAHGLTGKEASGVLVRAFDDVAGPIEAGLRRRLRNALDAAPPEASGAGPAGDPPAFVAALIAQPRAGATHPGLPRRVLEPAESHGDHCFVTAAFGVLLAPAFGAAPEAVFMTGLAHHLFNTTLPDAGYAADVLIGDALGARMAEAAADRALGQLREPLRQIARDAIARTRESAFGTPPARAFHAADVLDRTLEMEWHASAARFRLADALGRDTARGQLDICHDGFYQRFQQDVLERAGVWAFASDAEASGDGASAAGPPSPVPISAPEAHNT